ncbi:hypothetical protein KAFR_0B05480 [Kazachstania africana CBS 2517]|uniref:Ribosomal protein n=1 Tax=Kazachstania africana (strain ATCC 22294 / BCRC 22015 / CBS 2517 / CECT 1963 / NBRC 1671 / NRRL Y-8276) TaxID=1071382 RepID=H2AR43_KAZAF|nr:hypothetical protein KAFR_0B05480 [Kazachstania africana CBS 2517]CCF56843.1 hypothetical protein KAFR_0B05480 [Kazachstania africana CBS 2517]
MNFLRVRGPTLPNLLFGTRSLQTSRLWLEEASVAPSKTNKQQAKKKMLRDFLRSRKQAREPASNHPLYMKVPDALRFLRAVEVGQPRSQQTITLTTLVISEKGVPPVYGNVQLPTPLRNSKVVVLSDDPKKLEEVQDNFKNVHLVGGRELVDKFKNEDIEIDFDKVVATPDILNYTNQNLGKMFGPKGLLPNVKKGTVSENLIELMNENVSSMPFRQRAGCISLGIGKVEFSDKQILENIIATREAFLNTLSNQKTKKQSTLGKTTLTSTHGPGIVIDFI